MVVFWTKVFIFNFYQHHAQRSLTHVAHLLVVSMQSAPIETKLHLAHVILVSRATPILNVNQNAPSIRTVHNTWHVSETNVWTHVLECVESEHHVEFKTIDLNAHVIQVSLEILSLHVIHHQQVRMQKNNKIYSCNIRIMCISYLNKNAFIEFSYFIKLIYFFYL